MTPPPNLREFFDHQAYNRMKPSTWQPNIGRVHAVARALILLANGRCEAGLKIARENKSGIERVDENLDSPRELAGVLLQELQESLALHSREESVFKREGEYWSIIYQGQLARLKATRGLYFLARLLRQPRREFHVSELIAEFEEIRVLARVEGAGRQKWGTEATTVGARSFGPLLDAQAKAEYRRRLQDLGEDLQEAERFGDAQRAAMAHDEINVIAEQLASAVGLGGRDRPTGSDAERARSAVTKRIKESINKIAEVVPSLSRHLDARIKTGYFCSYNPHPDHLVEWKF